MQRVTDRPEAHEQLLDFTSDVDKARAVYKVSIAT
jgi:hypothetical protein